MANRSERDPPNLNHRSGEKPKLEMRRGSADSIRASRQNRLRKQAGYKAAICLPRHTNIGPCHPGGVHTNR